MSETLTPLTSTENKEFVPKYELVPEDDPILRQELPPFDFVNPPVDPVELAIDLVEHMLYHNGLGLSANQLGLPYRAFAMIGNPCLVCFNPVIVDASNEKQITLEEGCLSVPGLIINVRRPESIKIRYAQPNGYVLTQVFTGMTSRIMQHETDHLNGILFYDRVSKLVYDMAVKKASKYNRI